MPVFLVYAQVHIDTLLPVVCFPLPKPPCASVRCSERAFFVTMNLLQGTPQELYKYFSRVHEMAWDLEANQESGVQPPPGGGQLIVYTHVAMCD